MSTISVRKHQRFRLCAIAMVFLLAALGFFYCLYSPSTDGTPQVSVTASDKVKVQVYYETHCPDSKDFILNQLYPTYQAVSEIIDVELVPYGKAKTTRNPDGSFSFQCQHGVKECTGNTIQACALDKVKDYDTVMEFVKCMEEAKQPQDAAESCADKHEINYAPINSCATSNEGAQLLAKMGDKTNSLNPKLYFVPWIVINGKYSSKNQQQALTDLKTLVCDTYKGTKPSRC